MIKIVSFFEEHIEKIILAIVGLVCLWLLAAPPVDPLPRVLFSSNVVSYDNRKFSPGSIDNYIGTQAELLRQKLDQPPSSALPEPNSPAITLKHFVAMLDSAVSVDTGVHLPQPYSGSKRRYAKGEYNLPDIGEVNEVAVEHIRAVAYVPTEEVTEQDTYDSVAKEPNDVDIVTVQANFDAAGLYKRFRECFAGDNVSAVLRDPCLAKPVFAAVQLQRQELNPDGTWSDWQTVPRIKIDRFGRLLEIIEDADKLPPGGIKVRMVQFDNREVIMDLLQPPVYQIASANQEWFPPSLHKKFVELQKQQQMEEKRRALEEKKSAQMQEQGAAATDRRLGPEGPGGTYRDSRGTEDLTGGRTRTTRRNVSDRRAETGGTTDSGRLRDSSRLRDSGRPTDSGGLADSGRRSARGEQGDERQAERERLASARELATQQAITDVYNELNSIFITPTTDLSRMRQPLVFWAHDDTAEPKKTYRYRIRLGVFNPIAERDQSAPERDLAVGGSAQQDKIQTNIILWSEFSSPTQSVEIPGVLYFFAKGIQEAAKKVTVQVSKYMMGYWHSEDFLVGQGETIGRVVESKPAETNPVTVVQPRPPNILSGGPRDGRLVEGRTPFNTASPTLQMPETIDYSTGAILVDVVPVSDWSGGSGRSMLARHYFDMLYSFDGVNIERTPVDMKYWTAELRAEYVEIVNSQKEPREPLRDWGTQDAGYIGPGRAEPRRRGIAPTSPYGGRAYGERVMGEETMGEIRRGEERMR